MSDQAATYSFIPWVKQGMSNFINETRSPSGAATVTASLKVKTGTAEQTLEKVFELAGPGDVTGIQGQAVINTFPHKGDNGFLTYHLPYIEFYEEDFPWRYTPAKAMVDKLTPWVTLLVLEQGEFTVLQDASAPLPLLEVASIEVFPNPVTLWAWAHVHANMDIAPEIQKGMNFLTEKETDRFLNTHVKSNPDLAFSRVLSPRRLKNGASYTAFLIPTFEAGRCAGTGDSYDTTLPLETVAWSSAGGANLRYPVYYQWDFRTDNAANFEYAVRQLRALDLAEVTLGQESGGNTMQLNATGYGFIDPPAPYQEVSLVGALQPIGQNDDFLPVPGFTEPLRDLLNLTEKRLQETAGRISAFSLDPVVTPPVYGRWHAGIKMVEPLPYDPETPPVTPTASWLQHINLDPRYRAIAGVGSRIVQKNQEEYVRKAWEQLGDIQSVNDYLRELQAGVRVGLNLKEKYLAPIVSSLGLESAIASTGNDNLLMRMAPALSRIEVTQDAVAETPPGSSTAEGMIRESAVPLAVFEGSFRKLVKVRELDAPEPDGTSKETDFSNLISKLNSGSISAAGVKPVSDNPVNFYTIAGAKYASLKQNTVPELYLPGNTAKQVLATDSAQRLRNAVNDLPPGLVPVREAVKPALPQDVLAVAADVASDPLPAAKRKVKFALGLVDEGAVGTLLESTAAAEDITIEPLVVHPYFKQPMYEALKEYAEELFLPDISRIPQNTVTLLEVNQKFVEAFMVGLNHEMAAELLWREFPTDQRGSYFRQFWDKKDNVNTVLTDEQKTDITPIHTWPIASNLGEHQQGNAGNGIVLMIRADLLRKFPNAVIYAQEVVEVIEGQDANLRVDGQKKFPVSRADLDSGITMLTFDLDTATMESSPFGWYFVFGERPGQPAFGLEMKTELAKTSLLRWEQFSWKHLPVAGANLELADLEIAGGEESFTKIENSAQLAYATFRSPAMVAISADEFI